MPDQIYFTISFDHSIEEDIIEFITKDYGHLIEPIDKLRSGTYVPGFISVYLNLKTEEYIFDDFIKIAGFLKGEPKFISKIERIVLWYILYIDLNEQNNFEFSKETLAILGEHFDGYCWSIYKYIPDKLKK